MTKITVTITAEVKVAEYMKEYGVTKSEAIAQIKELIKTAGLAELTSNGFIKQ